MITSLDEAIGRLTSQTNKRIMRYLNINLEKYNITLEQWGVLLKLSQEDRISQRNLAEKVDKDQPTLTRILDILERKELVKREPSKEDKRSFSVCITGAGLQLKGEVEPYLEELFKKILQGITNENIEIYREVLMKINKNILDIQEEK